MLEKILTKLKAQRDALDAKNKTKSNVSDRSLGDLAKSLVSVITTDDILKVADLTDAIASIDGNINHYTATAVEAAKKKQIEDDKKTAEDLVKKAAEKKAAEEKAAEDKKNGITPPDPVIAELLEQNKRILEQLQGIKTEGVTQTRSDLLAAELKETPVIFRDATLKGFDRMAFKDDAEFDTYIIEIKESAAAAIQVGKESNLNVHTPTVVVKKPDADGVSPEMAEAIKTVTKVDKDDNKPF